ncbi:MAG: hypothetical protein ACRD1P_05715 [Thermoanaerobaculia bacterium]
MADDDIDTMIRRWAETQGLRRFNYYQENGFRSLGLADEGGRPYRITIASANPSGKVKVYAWDYGKRIAEYVSTAYDLPRSLDRAYFAVTDWMEHSNA